MLDEILDAFYEILEVILNYLFILYSNLFSKNIQQYLRDKKLLFGVPMENPDWKVCCLNELFLAHAKNFICYS